jgi:hypothetical protein
MFRASQRPSSGVPKIVSATSGIGHAVKYWLELTRVKHVEFDVAVNKCLRTDASSWSFLLIQNHDARNHEFKIV